MQERAHGLATQVEWSLLAAILRARRLLPTLGPRILEMTEGIASDEFARAVAQSIEAGRRHATYLQLVSLRAVSTLAEAGIPCVPLKGPPLSEVLYGDPGRRLSNDIDLLVPTDQLRAAVEVVRSLGYARPTDYVDESGLPQLHFMLVHEHEKLPPVELHWRVHFYERDFARECLLPTGGVAPSDWRPSAADELIALLLYYARDGFIDLRLASDVGAWWDVRGAELQSGEVDGRLRAYPALTRIVRVAARVADSVVGLPSSQILRDAPVGMRDRLAMRLANPNPHSSPSQLYADIGLVDGLLAPPGGFGAFVRRRLLPPREFLEELDRHAPKRWERSSLPRGAGMLGRYVLSLTRLALAPNEMLR
jgi:Uncharacterised nucleotidyltransferase